MKLLLLIELFLLLTILLFVVIATAITDWSKSDTTEYGVWEVCLRTNPKTCENFDHTENTNLKDCEGAWIATQAFSVLSIIFTGIHFLYAIVLLVKPSMIKMPTLYINFCLMFVNWIWLPCGWVMWLGVDNRAMCIYADAGTHLGSSWFLQIFAWLLSFGVLAIAAMMMMKWKKTPRFAGPAAYVPGPNAPHDKGMQGAVPYFSDSAYAGYPAASAYPMGSSYPVGSAYPAASAYPTVSYPMASMPYAAGTTSMYPTTTTAAAYSPQAYSPYMAQPVSNYYPPGVTTPVATPSF
jgi:hypothetical protein